MQEEERYALSRDARHCIIGCLALEEIPDKHVHHVSYVGALNVEAYC